VPPPDAAAGPGQEGFRFDRSGYRVPAIVVSPWVAEGEVFNDEYRHTSLIATLREQWGLGAPLTGRDAAARTFSTVFTLETAREPGDWPSLDPRPVPEYIQDALGFGRSLSALGKAAFAGIRTYAEQHNIDIDGLPEDPDAEVPPEEALHILHNFLEIFFPQLHPTIPSHSAS
jgi:phospholipase C